VKVFYSNLVQDGKNLVSHVKGVKLKITREIWSNVGGIKYSGMKVSKGNTARIQGFNKMQFYRSCVRNPAEPVARFHAGNLTIIPRLLAYIIAWQLTPRGSNHATLHEEDLILLYCIMNQLKVNWVSTMVEHMLKSTRLPDYHFPYVIFVSKLIDYFEVDTTNERNDTIKAASEIDNSTLLKMGFQKEDDSWIFRMLQTELKMKLLIQKMKKKMLMECRTWMHHQYTLLDMKMLLLQVKMQWLHMRNLSTEVNLCLCLKDKC